MGVGYVPLCSSFCRFKLGQPRNRNGATLRLSGLTGTGLIILVVGRNILRVAVGCMLGNFNMVLVVVLRTKLLCRLPRWSEEERNALTIHRITCRRLSLGIEKLPIDFPSIRDNLFVFKIVYTKGEVCVFCFLVI